MHVFVDVAKRPLACFLVDRLFLACGLQNRAFIIPDVNLFAQNGGQTLLFGQFVHFRYGHQRAMVGDGNGSGTKLKLFVGEILRG